MKEKELKKSISEIQFNLERLKRERIQTRENIKLPLPSKDSRRTTSLKPDHQSSKRVTSPPELPQADWPKYEIRVEQVDRYREENAFLVQRRAELERKVAFLNAQITEVERVKFEEAQRHSEKDVFTREILGIVRKQTKNPGLSQEEALKHLEERFRTNGDFERVKDVLGVERDEEVAQAIAFLQRKNEAMFQIVKRAAGSLGLADKVLEFERAEKNAMRDD
jgi:hypothetical protein